MGGPLRADRLFFFGGYEGLFENLGRTIVTTVPDDDARRGVLPTGTVAISPTTLPYLLEFPSANGPSLGGGLAQHRFGFDQELTQHFAQGRLDAVLSDGSQFFVRYTLDDAEQALPTDYPQFPRAFVSRNQFLTAEYRRSLSPSTFGTGRVRLQPHRASPRPSSRTRRRRSRRSCRAVRRWARSTSAACRASGRSSRPI